MELITAHELARELKLTVDTVWRYTRSGRIPSIRLGVRDYRYRLAEVMEALARGTDGAEATERQVLKRVDPAKLRALAGCLRREPTA
ncbi:MAG: helix-turn-helix transcriptional regulator [Bacteroidota bacterium]